MGTSKIKKKLGMLAILPVLQWLGDAYD